MTPVICSILQQYTAYKIVDTSLLNEMIFNAHNTFATISLNYRSNNGFNCIDTYS